MKKVIMFDTSYGSQNLGDYIINEAITEQMDYLLKDSFVIRYATHTPINKFWQNFKENQISKACSNADYKFLCGSNLFKYNLKTLTPVFNINIFDTKCYQNSISLGCGVAINSDKINAYTKYIYKHILSKEYIHSTRDDNTVKFLEELGFKAINTGCPTLWGLTKEKCKKIPTKKSDKVVFTLTDYNRAINEDQKLVDILNKNYKKVYFWTQGSNDLEHFKNLKNTETIEIISPNIKAYTKILDGHDVDYIGTRLHAGIYAMNHLARSIILAIDNRTRDMKNSYKLNSIERTNIDKLEELINSEFETKIEINEENINKWKNQFTN